MSTDATEIAEIASLGGEAAVDRFIYMANGRGGRDNITALLVEVLVMVYGAARAAPPRGSDPRGPRHAGSLGEPRPTRVAPLRFAPSFSYRGTRVAPRSEIRLSLRPRDAVSSAVLSRPRRRGLVPGSLWCSRCGPPDTGSVSRFARIWPMAASGPTFSPAACRGAAIDHGARLASVV